MLIIKNNLMKAFFALSIVVSVSCSLGVKSTKHDNVYDNNLAVSRAVVSSDWTMVWNDEFEYSGLPDPSKWGYDIGGNGWGNNETQYYTENRLENARVENGKLIITCLNESYAGSSYTSARLVTKNKGDWLYGKVVVRAKLPTGRGTWPAIWMLPTDWEYGGWPDSGEIDIMEHVGYDQNRIHQTVHTEAYNHTRGTQKSGTLVVDSVSSGFHDYSIEWFEDKIDFFIDDALVFTFENENNSFREWPFDKRFHLILNIAFGGDWGGAMGIDPSCLPQKMEVDYVRVYEKNLNPITIPVPGTVEAELFARMSGIDIENCVAGGQNVGWIDSGDWLEYDITVQNSGQYSIDYFVAGWENSASLELQIDNDVISTYQIPNTGAYQSWVSERQIINLPAGNHVLKVQATGSGWNLDKLIISPYQIIGVPVPGKIEAEKFDNMYGIQTETCTLGGENVGWIDSGDWLEYDIVVDSTGTYQITYQTAAWIGDANFSIYIDDQFTGSVNVPYTGAYQSWTTVVNNMELSSGSHKLKLVSNTAGWNIDWIDILN